MAKTFGIAFGLIMLLSGSVWTAQGLGWIQGSARSDVEVWAKVGPVVAVRQGKRFELTFDGEITDAVIAEVSQMAETLLSNPVIEDFEIHVVEDAR